jgi:Rieske Fe-S protein
MDRREFLEKAGLAGFAVIAGSTVLGNITIPTAKAFSRSAAAGLREVPLRLEDTPELKEIGGMYNLEIEDIDKNILVGRIGEEEFVAVDIKCTHKGCKVSLKMHADEEHPKDDEKPFFNCPCHGSTSKKPLMKYETAFKDGELTVKIPIEDEVK